MSNYQIASRTYPTEYWSEHGVEIIATANELHDDKWAFREARQLASNGLRTRSFEATGGELRHVWAQGIAIWLFVLLTQFSVAALSDWLNVQDEIEMTELFTPMLAIGALVAMTVSTRWPVLVVAVFSLSYPMLEPNGVEPGNGIAFLTFLVIATGLLMKFGSGRRVVSPGGLVAIVSVSLLLTKFWLMGPGVLLISVAVLGFAIVRLDPRLAAATAVSAMFVAAAMLLSLTAPDPTNTIGPGIRIELVVAIVAVLLTAGLALLTNYSTRRAAQRL